MKLLEDKEEPTKKDWEAGAAEEGGKAGKHTFGKPRKDSFREEAVIHCMKFCL